MKKHAKAWLALILSLSLLLSGCSALEQIEALERIEERIDALFPFGTRPEASPAPAPAPAGTTAPAPSEEPTPGPTAAPAGEGAAEYGDLELVPFDRMVYERPDLDAIEQSIQDVLNALEQGTELSRAEELLDRCTAAYNRYYTMYVLADIRNCQDLTDEYYAEEYRWCDEHLSEVEQMLDRMYYACADSPLAAQLEEDYFGEGFREEYSDIGESVYSDEAVELMQAERNLIAEYRALSSDPVIVWNGREENYYELLQRADDWTYFRVVDAYYEQYNERYADLYIRLVDVRSRLAAQLGYDSYEQMQYEYTFERDYTPEDAAGYLAEIRRYAVPFYKRLMETDPYGSVWYDEVDEDTLYALLGTAVDEIGGVAAEAFDFMSEYELYDIAVSPRKAGMSFQTYLTDYHAPFLFLDAAGDTEDILSFAHEFGHFTDAYANDDAYETIDLAECYSQGMEYLLLSRLGGMLEREDVENIARLKMLDTAALYVQQAAFAEFESRVYALGADNLSAEVLNELSLQLAVDYGFYTPGYDTYYGMGWTDITHYFEIPFYVITYPVSNDVAMQIYAMELEEAGSGMEAYLRFLDRDFSGLMEGVEAGGFESPFAPGRLENVVQIMSAAFGTAMEPARSGKDR